jgi:peptidoglycan/xylan/chitin deacetylase (PgdA/CDA1 family)
MVQAGMTIASHGYDHYWLATLPAEQQRREIQRSLAFLAELGQATNRWIFSYPYGSHNDSLLTIARELGCCVGLTTVVGLATAGDDPLLLPRLDTNDLPTTDSPTPTEWTQKALRLSAHR